MVNSEINLNSEKNKNYINPEFIDLGKLREYSINRIDKDYTYFDSNDLHIKIFPSGRFGLIDFTPFNKNSQVAEKKFRSMAMAFCGISNFIYAIEQNQFPEIDQNCILSNPTNPVMAKFAQQFGFEIDAGKEYIVKANLENIRKRLKILKESPIIERILKNQ